MPAMITVTGAFYRNSRPISGTVRFTPERLWVISDRVTWATLAPSAELVDGRFTVWLTPTDTDYVPWYYLVESPLGRHRIYVPGTQVSYGLKELLDEHRPGPRSAH